MTMEYFTSNDGYQLAYQTAGSKSLPPLILLHGFTGSSQVFRRNIPTLSKTYHIIAPDLRGHGSSAKPPHSFHVSRLAMDLHNLLSHLNLTSLRSVACIAGSLGCSILWNYAELFTADVFSHQVWIDQSPMQNYALDGSWGSEFGNKGMNCTEAVRALKQALANDPDEVYQGTIAACLAYRAFPLDSDGVSEKERDSDEKFFLEEARKGVPEWYGDLMADHTALDWRRSIVECFGGRKQNRTRVLVVASSRSGCFPAEGPMEAVRFAKLKAKENGKEELAEGVVVDWGGHWCYWEDPERFNGLVLQFLARST